MSKDTDKYEINPLQVLEQYRLTFEHLHYKPVKAEHITQFVAVRRKAVIELLKTPQGESERREAIIERARANWASTADVADQDDVPTLTGDLEDVAALAVDMEATLALAIKGIQGKKTDLRLDRFLDPTVQKERLFHFEGTVVEILLRYRDLAQRLTDDAHASALRSMRKGFARLQEGYQQFSQFAFDELSFTARHWALHQEVMAQLQAMVHRYEKVYGKDLGSISGRDDDNKVRREFIAAVALACLRYYGFAPSWTVHGLLARKSDGYEYQLGCIAWPAKDQEAIKRCVNEQIKETRTRAIQLAAIEEWPTRPLLDALNTLAWLRRLNKRPSSTALSEPDAAPASKRRKAHTTTDSLNLQTVWMKPSA